MRRESVLLGVNVVDAAEGDGVVVLLHSGPAAGDGVVVVPFVEDFVRFPWILECRFSGLQWSALWTNRL